MLLSVLVFVKVLQSVLFTQRLRKIRTTWILDRNGQFQNLLIYSGPYAIILYVLLIDLLTSEECVCVCFIISQFFIPVNRYTRRSSFLPNLFADFMNIETPYVHSVRECQMCQDSMYQ